MAVFREVLCLLPSSCTRKEENMCDTGGANPRLKRHFLCPIISYESVTFLTSFELYGTDISTNSLALNIDEIIVLQSSNIIF